MIKTFSIQNFRCFKEITIEPFERVNLIVGKNNVGKTALLEALWLHSGYYNPTLSFSIDTFRGLEKFQANALLWDIFHNFDPSKPVKFSSKDAITGKPRTLRIEIKEKRQSSVGLEKKENREFAPPHAGRPEGWMPTRMGDSEILFTYNDDKKRVSCKAYVEEDKVKIVQARGIERVESVFMPSRRRDRNEERADRLSRFLLTNKNDQLIRTLKVLEDRIENLVILYIAGDPVIHAEIRGENRLIPFPLMGDGIGQLLNIALAITYASGGAVLIDEIENGLHHSVLPGIGQAIAELANDCDVQVFATSHSDECIDALRQGIINSSSPDKSGRLFRLERKDAEIRVVSYSLDELEVAASHGIEVR